MTVSAKNKLRKRLDSYWKLELLNAVFVPAMMIFLSVSWKYKIGPISYFAMIPMCGLLYVGGIYWRAKRRALDNGSSEIWQVMPRISQLKIPLAFLSMAAVLLAIGAWFMSDWTRSRGDQWTATIAASLALLEYINYYHRQIQHFDHGPDFRRLLSGKGFRQSQLAKDLKVWQANNA